jgi:hypothetical protein
MIPYGEIKKCRALICFYDSAYSLPREPFGNAERGYRAREHRGGPAGTTQGVASLGRGAIGPVAQASRGASPLQRGCMVSGRLATRRASLRLQLSAGLAVDPQRSVTLMQVSGARSVDPLAAAVRGVQARRIEARAIAPPTLRWRGVRGGLAVSVGGS